MKEAKPSFVEGHKGMKIFRGLVMEAEPARRLGNQGSIIYADSLFYV